MKMQMQTMAALCACMAGMTVAADAGDAFLLQTKNTTLALRRQHGAWNVAHYGAKIASESDAVALAWDRWAGGNKYGQRRPAAYAAYGGDREHGFGFNKSFAYHNQMLKDLTSWLQGLDDVVTRIGKGIPDRTASQSAIFDLCGRLAIAGRNQLKPGIYIMQGRKILVR